VLGNVASESESTTVRTVLAQLTLVVRNYLSPAHRHEVQERVAGALWNLTSQAQAASDTQFQMFKAFAALMSSPEHIAVIRALREGTQSLPGLTVDQDLSWELLAALARTGAATPDDIEAALATDNTANGAQAAARARALLPTAAHKRAVFDQLVASDLTPNAIVSALAANFSLAQDPSVLEEFVADYFAMLEPMWQERTYKIAEYLAEGLYPSSLVSPSLVEATQSWLDTAPNIPALRRIVQENLAGVERALRVRALDS